MKRLLSLLLTVLMLFTAVSVIPSASADTAPVFKEGDELYLKIDNPSNWAESAVVMYVNFTSASRAENDNKSIIIAEADKSRYSIKMYSITARQLKAADVLRDGEVDITDVTYLQRQLTSGGGSL